MPRVSRAVAIPVPDAVVPASGSDAARLRSAPQESPARAVSRRAVIIGLICAAISCAATPYNDFKVAATFIAGNQFPIGALFVLLVLSLLVNSIFRAVAPSKVFTKGEMLTVWTLILVASGIPSSGMMRYFIPHLVYHKFASNSTNNWEQKVWAPIPEWLKFQDQEAADAFFKGYHRGEEHVPWGAWVGPLAAWMPVALLFLAATFFITAILRRQWVENEKFSFPLVTLPVMLAEEPRPGYRVNDLLRHPLLWLAVGICTAVHTVRGLHLLYPSIPDITLWWNLNDYFTAPPLNQIGWIPAIIYPLVIGIAFLLPGEVCFSLWFFYLFFLFEQYLCAMFNWDRPGPQGYGDTLYHAMQAYGGGLALVSWVAWTGRRHFRDIWEKATNGPNARSIDDSGELLSYRTAFWGFVLSYAGIAVWMLLAQVSGVMIVTTLVTLTLALVVISWVVCQAGMLFMAQPYVSLDVLSGIFGTGLFKVAPLFTQMRLENMLFTDTREMLAPSLLMGAKCAENTHFSPRPLMKAMLGSVSISVVISLATSIALPYLNGGGNSLKNDFMYHWAPDKPLAFLGGVASIPFRGSWTNGAHLLSGFAGVLLLLVMRARFNIGIHPIGFLCASVYAIKMLAASIFLGWVAKSLLQRYGGMKGYQGAIPFFLGLILGDTINAMVWIVIGNMTQVGYQILPA